MKMTTQLGREVEAAPDSRIHQMHIGPQRERGIGVA
jgi:hypothetical protein